MTKESTFSLGLAIAALGLTVAVPGTTLAQLATDVQCVGCVQSSDIEDGTISPLDLIPGSINTNTIANLSITGNKISGGAVTGAKIANSTISPAKLIPGSINTTTLANSSVTGNKIADGVVTSAKITNGTVLLEDLNQEVIDAINAGAGGATHTVDCVGASGDFTSIQDAVDASSGADRILLLSNCSEDVVIVGAMGLTISGDEDGDMNLGGDHTLTGTIFVDNRTVILEYLTVQNGTGPGIWFDGAVIGFLNNVVSTGHNGSGFLLNLASIAGVVDSSFTGNGTVDYGAGVEVANGSSARVINSTMSNNGNDGIGVFRDSFAYVTGSTLNNNGVESNFDAGFQIAHHSSVRSQNNTATGNGYAAVEVGAQSFFRSDSGDTLTAADDGGCDFLNNFDCPVGIDIYRQGYAEVRGTSTLNGGVQGAAASVFNQSLFEFRGGATVNGDIAAGGLAYVRARSDTVFNGVMDCNTDNTSGTMFGLTICRDQAP
ncbi:right-handed parallel beta-helix repeat-containing protein [Limibacillus sp. MBR-115]|uniref:right-handed parallel beta-helix repeat-containing protein n=1 Tax=Limibacillus sp. MBR-115 TaxID=3156465 RepID=UPI003398AB45